MTSFTYGTMPEHFVEIPDSSNPGQVKRPAAGIALTLTDAVTLGAVTGLKTLGGTTISSVLTTDYGYFGFLCDSATVNVSADGGTTIKQLFGVEAIEAAITGGSSAGTANAALTAANAATAAVAVVASQLSPAPTLTQHTASAPFYVAHRGCGDERPEHTLLAYKDAVASGARAVEVSVQTTADGQVFCMHDLTLDRTSTLSGNGNVAAWRNLLFNGAIDIGATMIGPACPNQPFGLLRDVLQEVSDNTLIFLEPKDASAASVAAIMAVLAKFPRAKIVWKCASVTTTGGQPGHAFAAQAAGYPTWVYLSDTDSDAAITLTASQADMIGIPSGATPSYISHAVSLAAAQGALVMCWEVHRRSQVAALSALGVAGMMCSGMTYCTRTTAMATATAWGTGIRAHGEIPHDDFNSNLNWPVISTANRSVTLRASNKSLLLGSLCPVANAAGTYTITFALRYPTLPATLTNHADFVFARPDDSIYYFQATTNTVGGYHLIIRGNGQLGLYKHDPLSGTSTQLGSTITTATPVAGAWMTFSVAVTPTNLTAQRTDDGSSAISVANSAYRGGYMQLNTASSDVAVEYRDVVIS